MANLDAFQDIMGIRFDDVSILETAVVHSSYINENPSLVSGHNERLEFLGDAFLGLVVAEKLYHDFPGLAEGEMTRMRSALVRGDTLARVGRTINLGDYLYMGKGEEASGGRNKVSNLAGAVEAVIAAVFLDRGFDTARDFVLKLLEKEMGHVVDRGIGPDYKSRLQEVLQSKERLAPSYRLVESVGPDHDKRFTVEVVAGETVLGTGTGRSKKRAETEAAKRALEKLSEGFTG